MAGETFEGTYRSPIGNLLITATDKGINSINFAGGSLVIKTSSTLVDECIRQLKEYFKGQRQEFTLPLIPEGTRFQEKVWEALKGIPYGETRTYSQLARIVDSNARAVGQANSRNPIAIIIPCHRVIGANGSLKGYRGGMGKKHGLLKHEAKRSNPELF